MEENEDFDVDDILNNLNKKKDKKKNTNKKKGNRGENQLADVFEERFPGKTFCRVIGSGNRWSQVELTEEMKNVFVGDLVTPPNFAFCVECKYGYQDIDLCSAFNGYKQFEEWLKKAKRDAEFVNKQPILCWKKPRQPWIAFINNKLFKSTKIKSDHMTYGEWVLLPLETLLALPDSFWLLV